MDSSLPKTLIYKIAISDDEKYVFAATESGPYVYIESLKKWFSLAGKDSPDQTYWSVEYLPGQRTARFCTYGRGLWDFKIEEELGVSDQASTESTVSVRAFPLPATSSVSLDIGGLENGGRLMVFDMEGRVVKSLKISAGPTNQTILWDLCDFSGRRVSPGNYICTVSSGPVPDFCKIVVE